MCVHSVLGAKRIARQYWRAWIETVDCWKASRGVDASPASIGGRGLKLFCAALFLQALGHRPPVLAGVD